MAATPETRRSPRSTSDTNATDLIVVGINPIERATVPQTARGIIDRIDEISFNSTFMLELAAIAFVEH